MGDIDLFLFVILAFSGSFSERFILLRPSTRLEGSEHTLIIELADRIHGLMHAVITYEDPIRKLELLTVTLSGLLQMKHTFSYSSSSLSSSFSEDLFNAPFLLFGLSASSS